MQTDGLPGLSLPETGEAAPPAMAPTCAGESHRAQQSPTTGVLDYGKVNVRFTGTAGPEELIFVDSAARCHPTRGGWYYDLSPQMRMPGRVVVCEATCRRIRLEANGVVDVNVGCTTRID